MAGHRTGATADLARVDEWREIWDATYLDHDPLAGWVSSLTGEPYPAEVMREWLDATADRIGDVAGRSVLEIGAGTGLVTRRLAGRAADWLATDVSAIALDRIEQSVAGVRTEQLAAHELADVAGRYDVVVLNSVVQYFPSEAYLGGVLAGAVDKLAPGGRIVVGDVRSLPLQPALRRALREHGRPAPGNDAELLLDPRWFTGLAPVVRFAVKPSRCWSEMTAFRYDVVLGQGPATADPPPGALDWSQVGDLTRLSETLRDRRALTVRRIPNAANARWLADTPRGVDLRALSGLAADRDLDLHLGVDLDDPTRVVATFAPRVPARMQFRARTVQPGSRQLVAS